MMREEDEELPWNDEDTDDGNWNPEDEVNGSPQVEDLVGVLVMCKCFIYILV